MTNAIFGHHLTLILMFVVRCRTRQFGDYSAACDRHVHVCTSRINRDRDWVGFGSVGNSPFTLHLFNTHTHTQNQ